MKNFKSFLQYLKEEKNAKANAAFDKYAYSYKNSQIADFNNLMNLSAIQPNRVVGKSSVGPDHYTENGIVVPKEYFKNNPFSGLKITFTDYGNAYVYLEDHDCRICHGTGLVDGECDDCHGDGEVICPQCNGEGLVEDPKTNDFTDCPTCNGTGKVDCPTCRGTKKVKKSCEHCKGEGHLDVDVLQRFIPTLTDVARLYVLLEKDVPMNFIQMFKGNDISREGKGKQTMSTFLKITTEQKGDILDPECKKDNVFSDGVNSSAGAGFEVRGSMFNRSNHIFSKNPIRRSDHTKIIHDVHEIWENNRFGTALYWTLTQKGGEYEVKKMIFFDSGISVSISEDGYALITVQFFCVSDIIEASEGAMHLASGNPLPIIPVELLKAALENQGKRLCFKAHK